jgi:hypothetical protein
MIRVRGESAVGGRVVPVGVAVDSNSMSTSSESADGVAETGSARTGATAAIDDIFASGSGA